MPIEERGGDQVLDETCAISLTGEMSRNEALAVVQVVVSDAVSPVVIPELEVSEARKEGKEIRPRVVTYF
jgi:hypothetical protein